LSTIWAETADNARSAARSYVLGGLSEKHHGLSNFWAADRINVGIHDLFYTLHHGYMHHAFFAPELPYRLT